MAEIDTLRRRPAVSCGKLRACLLWRAPALMERGGGVGKEEQKLVIPGRRLPARR